MKIKWDDSFSVDVEKFDNQHKELIDILNELYESKENFSEVFGIFRKRIDDHFKSEEDFFEEFSYPEAVTHTLEHDKFLKKIDELSEQNRDEILTFLTDWLLNHIKGTDQKYSSFFNENGL